VWGIYVQVKLAVKNINKIKNKKKPEDWIHAGRSRRHIQKTSNWIWTFYFHAKRFRLQRVNGQNLLLLFPSLSLSLAPFFFYFISILHSHKTNIRISLSLSMFQILSPIFTLRVSENKKIKSSRFVSFFPLRQNII
jgi:hypothetical protein